eukprot:gene42722-53289_t
MRVENRISLTVTEPPEGELQLRRWLSSAIRAGEKRGSSLSEIQLSRDAFPTLGLQYFDVPVKDSGDPGVLRLVYDPRALALRFEGWRSAAPRTGPEPMIPDFDRLRAAPTNLTPYPHVVVPNFLAGETLASVSQDFPDIDMPGLFLPEA